MQANEMQPGSSNAGAGEERKGSTEQMQENRQGQQDISTADNPVEGRNVNVQNKPGAEVDQNRNAGNNRDAKKSQKNQSSFDPRQHL
jgi:hypothetical protein